MEESGICGTIGGGHNAQFRRMTQLHTSAIEDKGCEFVRYVDRKICFGFLALRNLFR